MVYHRIKNRKKTLFELSRSSSIDERLNKVNGNEGFEDRQYLKGEYKLILQLCQLLDFGLEAKTIVDECIDECNHLQNLREAIFDYKKKIEDSNNRELLIRGQNYLIRYFYLIVFAEYLIEEVPLEKTFLSWLEERREVSNLVNPERGYVNFN